MKKETPFYPPSHSPSSEEPQEAFTLEEKIKYGLLGLLLLGGSFFIGRKLIRQARANTEEKKTFEEGNAATYAKQIKMAFENDMWWGWGTNEEALRKVIRSIPSKEEFKKVIHSYQKLYARSMMADMQDELTTNEYNEMLAIIATKPERGASTIEQQLSPEQYRAWAKRLRAAFSVNTWGFLPYGTDEDAIKAVLMELPTQAAFQQTANAYKQEYGDDLSRDLQSELAPWEMSEIMSLLKRKPKA
jgi:hypothetical protein